MMKKIALLSLFVSILLGSIWNIGSLSAETTAIPAGFTIIEAATDVGFAVGMVILPNGDIMAPNKGVSMAEPAPVKLIVNGVTQPTPVLEIYTNPTSDSGLLAIVLDPDFETNGWFYIYYATAPQSKDYTGQTALRLSRFTYDFETRTADPNSETIILDDFNWDIIHHGNSLTFDEKGNLFIGLGDRRVPEDAQDKKKLHRGKILRIKPLPEGGYEIPADNPFVNKSNTPDEIYAMGVRNPFRIARRPIDNLIVFGDVGTSYWEEINFLVPGANYGWPVREGPCNAYRFAPCGPTPSKFTDPFMAYRHDTGLEDGRNGALTGLGFYDGNAFPAVYRNKLFFADLNQGFLAYTDADNPNGYTIFGGGTPFEGVVDIVSADNGLYLLNIFRGKIYFIYYNDGTNQIPSASFKSNIQHVKPGQPVTFDASESTDPDGTKLVYHWDFGDGTLESTSNTHISHSFGQDGNYAVKLTVTDLVEAGSLAAEETIYVYSGELPEISLTIQNAAERVKWHGGDTLEFAAVRSTLTGLDPLTPYTWQIDQHHNEHTHPQIGGIKLISSTLPIPTANHDGASNLWMRFYLTVKTDTGQEIVLSKEIFPQHAELTVDPQPGPFDVRINGGVQKTPYRFTAITGVEQLFSPPAEVFFGGDFGRFDHWFIYESWGVRSVSQPLTTTRTLSFLAPSRAQTYAPIYVYDRPGEKAYLPLLVR